MVEKFSHALTHHHMWRVEMLSSEDREQLKIAAERARQRLKDAGLLDVERDAQREIKARVEAA